MKKNALAALYEKDGTKKVLSSLISIVAGLLVGGIAVLIVGLCNEKISLSGAWDGIRIIFAGIFSTGRDAAGTLTWGFNAVNLGNMLFRATPLIMTGLSVAVAFKTGLFNIGAPGQYLISTMVTLMVALSIPSSAVPVGVIWVLAFLAGCLSGALWGAIPGLVKALLNINEVLACIMTNWIAANLVTWMFDISNFKNMVESTKSGYIYKTTFNGVATPKLGLDAIFPGSQVNGGILVAIVIAIAMYILMNKTTLGYELKACGANRHAARYAGIRDKRNIVLSMAIAGALAGAGAALYWLSGNTEFYWSTYQALPAVGFNGIPVALLALNNPIAVIFTGIFMAMLNIVGLQLTNLTAYNEYITDVIISVIVYLSAFSLAIRMMLSRKKKPHAHVEETAAPAADAAPPEEPAEEKSVTQDDLCRLRSIHVGFISPSQLKRAKAEGKLDHLLAKRDEIEVPLDTGGAVTVVCCYVTPTAARFVFKDCWDEGVMNDEATNKTGYFKSKGRKHVLEDIYPHIAAEWREIIVPRTFVETIEGERVEYSDPLWLPSATDVFGTPDGAWWNDGDDDFQLPVFTRERDRVKECGDKGTYLWWLRSVDAGATYAFCGVYTDGSAPYGDAYYSCGFAPGFDI